MARNSTEGQGVWVSVGRCFFDYYNVDIAIQKQCHQHILWRVIAPCLYLNEHLVLLHFSQSEVFKKSCCFVVPFVVVTNGCGNWKLQDFVFTLLNLHTFFFLFLLISIQPATDYFHENCKHFGVEKYKILAICFACWQLTRIDSKKCTECRYVTQNGVIK